MSVQEKLAQVPIPEIRIIDGVFDPKQAVLNLINYLMFFVSVIAVVVIIWAGIQFITSGGDAEKSTKARNTLIYAVAGIVVIVLSYAIVNWAANYFAPNL